MRAFLDEKHSLPGRRYALIPGSGVSGQEVGLLRLIEAPPGAPANRPRPQSKIMEPGLAVIKCRASDFAESNEHLKAQGFSGIAPPMFYFFRDYTPLLPDFKEGYRTLVETMPAQPPQPIIAVADTCVQWETINTMVEAPPGTYFMYGGLGQGLTMEMWEFRQWRPPAQPPYPTSLDRTSLAITTLVMDNLAAVHNNARRHALPIIGDGALPTPEGERPGFYSRSAVAELLEIVQRI
jgi:hypothetical protein